MAFVVCTFWKQTVGLINEYPTRVDATLDLPDIIQFEMIPADVKPSCPEDRTSMRACFA